MLRAAWFLCVFTATVLGAPPAYAGAFDVNDTTWEGTSEFYALMNRELGSDRVSVLATLDWSRLEPNDAILLLHPQHVLATDKLAAFLDRGGRAAILDDFAVGDRILAHFQIERVAMPARPAFTLRHNAQLAIAEPAREPGPGHAQALHATVQDVERLITNHATALRNDKMTPVLRIRAADGSDALLALAGNFGSPPRGKLFAMGDPSAVTNQMLRYPGNRAFALGLARYLAQDPAPGGRGGRLLVLTNGFGETGSFAGVGGAVSELRARMERVSDEAERLLHDGLSGLLGLVLAATVALGIGVWTSGVTSRVYRLRIPSFLRRVPIVAQGGLVGRAALLASDSAPLSLAALEIKNAFEETLTHDLGLGEPVSHAALIHEIRARAALAPGAIKDLQAFMLELSKIETMIGARRAVRVTRRDLMRFSRTGSRLSALVRAGKNQPSAA